MIAKALEDLAATFWDQVGPPPSPRDLDYVIHCFRPSVSLVPLSNLNIQAIRQWLSRTGHSLELDARERPLNGCLVADHGAAFLFVRAGLPAEDHRMIVAHEFAHYLADYEQPRNRACRRVGPALLSIFDGDRPASAAEDIEASLAGIDLKPHVHYMERSADGTWSEAVNQVEQTANDLALELIAPWRTVQETMQSGADEAEWVETLRTQFGLPASWAEPYADRLLQHTRGTRPFSEALLGEPGASATGVTPSPTASPTEAAPADDRLIPDQELERALGQTIHDALNLEHWDENGGLEAFLARVPPYIHKTLQEEVRLRQAVRYQVLSQLASFSDAPADAGVYRIDPRHLRAALHKHLLSGAVTAAHGASTSHDGLTATIVSIGVSLVRYDGQQRSWRTTFLRHDYGVAGSDPVREIRDLLDRRGRRSTDGPGSGRDQLSYLLRRGFMTAAERRSLLDKTNTRWRLGRGVPAPLELLSGSGSMALIDEVLPVLDQLLLQHRHWVFLPSMASNRALVTLANALEPGQLAIIQKGKASLDAMLAAGDFDTGYRRKVLDFTRQLGEVMVIGGFRATEYAPAQLFVAHAEHALPAGIIAMADATLQATSRRPLAARSGRPERQGRPGRGRLPRRGRIRLRQGRRPGFFSPERIQAEAAS